MLRTHRAKASDAYQTASTEQQQHDVNCGTPSSKNISWYTQLLISNLADLMGINEPIINKK